ncbi:MAG: nucleotidyltransferase [Clostridia bacterium]|nr:nucleotidyltransferase [Oscillospiraceae bacterium]MBQ7006084.1 nucleotidyltransferase [Clostridia bacterium]
MVKTTLVVMAAGMGSRYGGLKQIDPVGPNGEIILDYSVFDAVQAGFDRVIFVIKHEIEEDFKKITDRRYDGKIEVDYAFQDMADLPDGFTVPEGRVKPWGTGQAVLACRNLIDGPFAVINADDYYGKQTFRLIHEELIKKAEDNGKYNFCMVGFRIENTLTENGTVARGVCQTNEASMLTDIVERTKIAMNGDRIQFTENEGASWTDIPEGTVVSMNCWGFTPDMMEELKKRFPDFLEKGIKENPLKCEYFLPFVVDELLKENKAQVKVLETSEKWYGVTYKEDRKFVTDALGQKVTAGIYPEKLW